MLNASSECWYYQTQLTLACLPDSRHACRDMQLLRLSSDERTDASSGCRQYDKQRMLAVGAPRPPSGHNRNARVRLQGFGAGRASRTASVITRNLDVVGFMLATTRTRPRSALP